MITFIYLNSFQSFSHDRFIEQLKLYDSLSDVWLIDNSLQPGQREQFLSEIEQLTLDHVNYIINDTFMTFGALVNQYLTNCNDDILFVLPGVIIPEADIMEMIKIYDLSRHHAFVIPRSNAGHYQTLPVSNYLYPDEMIRKYDEDECRKMASGLRDYTIMPGAFDGCVLMDGKRVFDVGEMSEDFLTQSVAIYKLSLIMNNYGYMTVAANHAYAENVTDETDCNEKNDWKCIEGNIGELKHKMEMQYLESYVSPEEIFAERIWNEKENKYKKKLLFYAAHVGKTYNGSNVLALNLIKGLSKIVPEDWEISVVMKEESIEFFHMRDKYPYRFMGEKKIEGFYDVAFAPFYLYSGMQQRDLIHHALKIISWPLDIIVDRSNYINNLDSIIFHESVAKYSDGFMFLSEEAKSDYELYYGRFENVHKIPKHVNYIAIQNFSEEDCEEILPFDNYYLVFGNSYLHKMIEPAVTLITHMKENFIVVGAKENGYLSRNVYAYCSGQLSDELVAKLYKSCNALIFPSIYEGFGIPVVQALNLGKNVYLMDTELNHELENLADAFQGHLFYMDSLYHLPQYLLQYDNIPGPVPGAYKRDEISSAMDCWKLIEDVKNQNVDYEKLNMRWHC